MYFKLIVIKTWIEIDNFHAEIHPVLSIQLNSQTNQSLIWVILLVQKQPSDVFCKKSCSYKFRKIHKKTPVAESLFQ